MKTRSLGESFRCAFQGVLFVLKTERNMVLHFIAAGLVVLLAVLLQVSSLELMCLTLAVAIVLISELVNTALEILCNIVCCDLEPRIKRVKDIAAGAVLEMRFQAVLEGILGFGQGVFSGTGWLLKP